MKARSQILLVFILFIFNLNAIAQEKVVVQKFAELKSEYLSLRNTDVSLNRSDEWQSLANRFESLVNENPHFSGAPSALFNASILLEILYKQLGDEGKIIRSIKLLKRIAREYPKSDMADDALVKLGEVHLFLLNKPDPAKKWFKKVVSDFPNSDMTIQALARIRSIEDGSYSSSPAEEVLQNSTASKKIWKGRRPLIVLDPGHGGEDYGAQGVGGLLEKDVVLSVAFQLERLLVEELGALVRLTRRDDSFVPLATRTQIANDFEADLFISLHVNASPQHNAKGVEVYFLDNSDNQASLKLAERENASMRFESSPNDLQFILSDLIQSAKLDESIVLANVLNDKIVKHLSKKWKKVKVLGVKKAPFYVLVGAHMPCVLLELFFIDHHLDGPRLAKRDFRQDLALSIYHGISEYISKSGKFHS